MTPELARLLIGLVALLTLGTAASLALRRVVTSPAGVATVEDINVRMRSWWAMAAAFAIATLTGGVGSIVLFSLISVLALREFVTLVHSSRADHRTLVAAFFIFTPLQYLLVGFGWYGFFAILVPVYVFVLVPTSMVIMGDTERFLERAATIQWGLMVCVYCVSYVPALLLLDLDWDQPNALLVFYLVLVVQLSDVLQYIWGKLLGRRRIAPRVSPNKTWEGYTVQPGRRRRHVARHLPGGFRRRAHDGRGEARPGRQGLRCTTPRPRRCARPHRLALLRRADLLPPDPLLLLTHQITRRVSA
jgi:phosphatidate cytidylyltransferase